MNKEYINFEKYLRRLISLLKIYIKINTWKLNYYIRTLTRYYIGNCLKCLFSFQGNILFCESQIQFQLRSKA